MKCSFCTNPAESLTAKLCPECWGGIAPDMQAVLLEGRVLAELIREWGGMLNIDGSAYKKKDIEELMAKHPKPGAGPSKPDGDDVDYGKPGGDVPVENGADAFSATMDRIREWRKILSPEDDADFLDLLAEEIESMRDGEEEL